MGTPSSETHGQRRNTRKCFGERLSAAASGLTAFLPGFKTNKGKFKPPQEQRWQLSITETVLSSCSDQSVIVNTKRDRKDSDQDHPRSIVPNIPPRPMENIATSTRDGTMTSVQTKPTRNATQIPQRQLENIDTGTQNGATTSVQRKPTRKVKYVPPDPLVKYVPTDRLVKYVPPDPL